MPQLDIMLISLLLTAAIPTGKTGAACTATTAGDKGNCGTNANCPGTTGFCQCDSGYTGTVGGDCGECTVTLQYLKSTCIVTTIYGFFEQIVFSHNVCVCIYVKPTSSSQDGHHASTIARVVIIWMMTISMMVYHRHFILIIIMTVITGFSLSPMTLLLMDGAI